MAALEAQLGALPCYIVARSLAAGRVDAFLDDYALPAQEAHAVYASPRQVPAKVAALIACLQDHF